MLLLPGIHSSTLHSGRGVSVQRWELGGSREMGWGSAECRLLLVCVCCGVGVVFGRGSEVEMSGLHREVP